MLKKFVLLSILLFFPFLSVMDSKAQEYTIAVLANRGADQCIKQWKPTAEYLAAKVGKPFVIVPLNFDQLPEWTKDGKVDFVLSNSAFYAELSRLYNVQAVATMLNHYKDQPLDQFGGVVIVKKDSPVNKLSDFKGKEFMCVKRSSFGGWLMAHRLFLDNGIEPDRDFKSLRVGSTHDNVVYAVYNGAVDGGTVRTGTLEKMAEEGKVALQDFKIVAQVRDEFPQLHSTRLYPEWPLAAVKHVPEALRDQVSQHLMAISPGDPAAKAAKIMGWKSAMDYEPVVECLRITKTEGFGE
jgi:phosphate/phosphite/phosphonate ABC transporter binding protein